MRDSERSVFRGGSGGPHGCGTRAFPSGRTPKGSGTSIDFCGIPVTLGLSAAEAVESAFAAPEDRLPVLTTFVNPYSFHIARHDGAYADSLARFTYVFPDGIGVTWGLRALHGYRAERISFDSTSIALPVLRRAQREGRSVMLIGGGPGVAREAAERLRDAVAGLVVCAAVDGFRSFDEYRAIAQTMKPDIVICGMGAPLQEQLLIRLGQSGVWKGLGYSCGGYLDQLRGGVEYYPAVMDRLNLRWLYRMAREPRRLWRRYLIEYQDFLAALAREAWYRRRTTG